MENRKEITVYAVLEALLFIEENWTDWIGDFDENELYIDLGKINV